MSRILEARTSFNGGELSPLIAARIDVAKFSNGCARMENFLPTTQGPAICRPGTRHVAEVKDSADRTWLMRFERSEDDSYILEWGDGYVRFYTNRGVLLSAGVPYEIVSRTLNFSKNLKQQSTLLWVFQILQLNLNNTF
jgi:hypothetical protein